ncbi:kinase-like protein [Peniophora sp. CONT]|nr:kinase-like protein [Peniophora sp. CONT]
MATFKSPNGRHYRSTGAFAEGSFGKVHKCTVHEKRAKLPGYVALKVVSWQGNGLDKATVLAEKVALETITPHDGIIQLLDSWTEESELYLVMDYYEHGNLLEYSKTHHIDDDTLCSLHLQFLRIIEHIHSQGFVFFDIKPDNMVLADVNPPRLVLIDFGSARTRDELDAGPCKILATDRYAAPELRDPARRHTADASCDYYAWFISLFYLKVVQDWPKNRYITALKSKLLLVPGSERRPEGPEEREKIPGCLSDWERSLNYALVPNETEHEVLFHGLLVLIHMSAPQYRKERMTSHPWVTSRYAAPPAPEPSLFGGGSLLGTAAAHAALFGSQPSGIEPVAGSSTSTAPREPASAKRAGAEKCLQKEKVGKGSGVGSTASNRATSACKKAVKTCAAVGVVKDADGPAQAVLKRRATDGPAHAVLKRRAAEGRVSYKKFM